MRPRLEIAWQLIAVVLGSFPFCSNRPNHARVVGLNFRILPPGRAPQMARRSVPIVIMVFQFLIERSPVPYIKQAPLDMKTALIFNRLPTAVANMHLYFSCYLQERRDARRTRRYAPSSALFSSSSPSDRE